MMIIISKVPWSCTRSRLFRVGYAFSGNTPFDRNKNSHQTPFGSPSAHQPWQQVSPSPSFPSTSSPREQQKITPLTQSQQPVEQEAQFQQQPPELRLDLFKSQAREKELDENQAVKEEQKQVEKSTEDVVMSDIGLNRYLSRVYATTGISLTITLAAALAGTYIPNLADIAEGATITSGILSFLALKMAYNIKPIRLTYEQEGQTIFKTKNTLTRLITNAFGCVCLGLSGSSLFLSLNQISLMILPMTMGITASIFGGAALLGMILPRSFMLGYGSVLFGGIIGLLSFKFALLGAASLGTIPILNFSLTSSESLCGIVLFSALSIYDTHMAIGRYKKGDADHLGTSIQILLDLWNLIIRIAKEVAKAKLKQKQNKK